MTAIRQMEFGWVKRGSNCICAHIQVQPPIEIIVTKCQCGTKCPLHNEQNITKTAGKKNVYMGLTTEQC